MGWAGKRGLLKSYACNFWPKLFHAIDPRAVPTPLMKFTTHHINIPTNFEPAKTAEKSNKPKMEKKTNVRKT
jgi:hypothetical protein